MNLTCKILQLEGDGNDLLFFRQALRHCGFAGVYRRVSTVEAVIRYLSGKEEFANRQIFPIPDVLVFDCNPTGSKMIEDLSTWLEDKGEYNGLVRVGLTRGINPANADCWLRYGVQAVLKKGVCAAGFESSVEKILRLCVLQRRMP